MIRLFQIAIAAWIGVAAYQPLHAAFDQVRDAMHIVNRGE